MDMRPLHGDFGVEVSGFDVQTGSSSADIAELRKAYDEHAMLLFRGGQRLSHERHVEIAGWFGPPPPIDDSGTGSFVSLLRNEEAAGSAVLPFHSDLTYTDYPVHTICLQAIALPEKPTSTIFISGAAAWDCLSADLQDEIADLSVRHELPASMLGLDWPHFEADHPLKFPHPRTGRAILFATEHHATRIHERDRADGQALLSRLFEELYAPVRRYEHFWQPNDVLLWDNLTLQHSRPEVSDPGCGSRTLQRVALSHATLQETIDIARKRASASEA